MLRDFVHDTFAMLQEVGHMVEKLYAKFKFWPERSTGYL